MKERIEAFLADLDRTLAPSAQGKSLEIYHLGRSALVWHYAYSATTQDFDIIRPDGAAELLALALRLFGPDTLKALEHGLYLQVVDEPLPPMPWGYKKRATEIAGSWKALRVFRLGPYDLVASKLRRFWPKDRADIRLLCDLVEIEPDRLEHILEEAYPFNMEKDGDEFRDSAFRSLRIVQRYLRHEIDSF
jgi:Nucleotidyltransferase of unknown function (DUF6036)